jgi:serine/threonine-protein kinase
MMALRKQQNSRSHIGPYQVFARIGEGGMGSVYLTKMDGPPGFNKMAVVKELRADLAGSSEFTDMFLNEARLAARLTHPNVVHTYGANEENGQLYIAMEYLDGQPWSKVRDTLWANRSLPVPLHLKMLADALAGLHYAHELKDYNGANLQIVHCDVSPQNVFVTYDGQVKIVDFGVARVISGKHRPKSNMLVGKLAYIAPEQARGEELDRRADIFAVGVMLWEALTGQRFVSNQNWDELREKRANGQEPRVRAVMPKVPRAIADVCDRAMAHDPALRFETAAKFRDAILGYLSEVSPNVDSSQIGELVVGAFRAERDRVHALIERQLKLPPQYVTVEDLVSSATVDVADHTIRADLSELASVSRLRDDHAVVEASTVARARSNARATRRRAWTAGVGGAVALAALGLGVHLRSTPKAEPAAGMAPAPTVSMAPGIAGLSGPSMASAVVPAADSAAQAAPATVHLVISASPAEAKLFMDGVPLRSNPFNERVSASGDLHLLRALGPGLQAQERVIQLDRDHEIKLVLEPLPQAVQAVAQPTARPAHRAPVVERSAVKREAQAAVETSVASAPKPAADSLYDQRINTDSAARKIYEDDPYR